MPNISQYIGSNRPPASIINEFSAGGTATTGAPFTTSPGKQILSGALTANTLATALSITGAGMLMLAGLRTMDATARTVRLKITIDGVSCFDATSSSIAVSADGIVGVGSILNNGTAGGSAHVFAQVTFNSSLLIQVASSLTETDKIALKTVYQVY